MDEEIRQRKLADAYWWIEKNYCGKKVRLNPVVIIKENRRLIVPHKEDVLVEALKLGESQCNLKLDWQKYNHWKKLGGFI